MAVLFSDGLRSRFIQRVPYIFNGGHVDVYSGPQPDSPNSAPTGVHLARIAADDGLFFVALGNYAMKHPDQAWTLSGIADGVAGWWRLSAADGFAGVSLSAPRIDGLCYPIEDPHSGLILPDLTITTSTFRAVTQFLFTL